MWARRLGVPPLWPSRVKVFFLGMLTSMFNFSVFQYLSNANVEYLDLQTPLKKDIICRLPVQDCLHSADPVACTVLLEDRHSWRGMNLSKPCQLPAEVLRDQTCQNPVLPLSSITGDLGSLHTVNSGVNPFKLWSILFLILTSLLSVSIVIHDLALLQEGLRAHILSIPNMKYATPCLWDCLACVQCRRRWRRSACARGCKAHRACYRCLCTLLLPFVTLFQVVAFMVVMYPFSLLVCLVAPIRMSRIMVFLSSILCIFWSVVFVTVTALLDTHAYAVLWGLSTPKLTSSCVCLCEYPLSRSVLARVVVLGIGVCWQAFNLTFRALRGLRRAQWANMFSVLYAVPIEAFPVVWERPPELGGGSIKWRGEGEAVQAEPAFDPFCLMDEQPESGSTRVVFMPVLRTEQQQFIWDPYTGALDTEIGCCGFPRPAEVPEIDSDGTVEFNTPCPFSGENSPSVDVLVDNCASSTAKAAEDEAAVTAVGVPSQSGVSVVENTVFGRPSLPVLCTKFKAPPSVAGAAPSGGTSPTQASDVAGAPDTPGNEVP